MKTSTSPWTPFVRSDVYLGPDANEDGERREELCYYVVCENERGDRFASKASATTEKAPRDVVEALAEAFCVKVAKALAGGADPSRSAKWTAIEGAYGSAAWSEEAELENEARDLEGEAGPYEANRFRREVGIGA